MEDKQGTEHESQFGSSNVVHNQDPLVLISEHSKLIEKYYSFLEEKLLDFRNAIEKNQKPLEKIGQYVNSAHVKNKIKYLSDLNKQQRKLFKDLQRAFKLMKIEAYQQQKRAMTEMPSKEKIAYFMDRIAILHGFTETYDDCVTSEHSVSTETLNNTDGEQASSILDKSSAMYSRPMVKLTISDKKTTAFIKDPLQFQLKRLAELEAMEESLYHHLCHQKLQQLCTLLNYQLEQLHVTVRLLDECLDNNVPSAISYTEETKKIICKFYVTRKKRYCRMLASKGRLYCGQHMVAAGEPDVS